MKTKIVKLNFRSRLLFYLFILSWLSSIKIKTTYVLTAQVKSREYSL